MKHTRPTRSAAQAARSARVGRRLYVAYGANTNHAAMTRRCPEAEFIGPGEVVGWRLEFRGVADVVPDRTYDLQVAAWLISPADEARLDAFEGYPRLYIKKDLLVDLGAGRRRRAMAYVMTWANMLGPPPASYWSTLLEGYGDCGLSLDQLHEARERATAAERGRWKGYRHHSGRVVATAWEEADQWDQDRETEERAVAERLGAEKWGLGR